MLGTHNYYRTYSARISPVNVKVGKFSGIVRRIVVRARSGSYNTTGWNYSLKMFERASKREYCSTNLNKTIWKYLGRRKI